MHGQRDQHPDSEKAVDFAQGAGRYQTEPRGHGGPGGDGQRNEPEQH
jgi:hypothetical protein